MMKRTTIMLPDDLYALLDRERHYRDVSMAHVVREAVEAYLTKPTSGWEAIIGIAEGDGLPPHAADLDEFLAEHLADDIYARRDDRFRRPEKPSEISQNESVSTGA